MTPHVLYEDNHVLVAVKPANMPTQADFSGDMDFLSLCKDYIKVRYQKPGAVYLGLVHRLDRPVGGVMVFARTSKAAARLSEQVRTKALFREYAAVVQGIPPTEGELHHWLLKDPSTNTTRAVPENTPGAKFASLSYWLEAKTDQESLLRVRLHTGRSHQIRVQFSASGYPLWGDARYGGGKPGMQIALHAVSIAFTHPTTREYVSFSDPPAQISPWKLFHNHKMWYNECS